MSDQRRKLLAFVVAVIGTAAVAAAPSQEGLSIRGQYAIATMFFAAVLW